MTTKYAGYSAVTLALLLAVGCSKSDEGASAQSSAKAPQQNAPAAQEPAKVIKATPEPTKPPPNFAGAEEAMAEMQPTEGNTAVGTVIFRPDMGMTKMRIHVSMRNVEPGPHGFHVHAVGDCSAPDGTSAGGHFAPASNPHGAPDSQQRHAGDLGNVQADARGYVEQFLESDVLGFSGETSVLGKAVILHGGADDLSSQPSGAAGPRIACGVVKVVDTSQY